MIISLFPQQTSIPWMWQWREGALKCAILVCAESPKLIIYCVNLSRKREKKKSNCNNVAAMICCCS